LGVGTWLERPPEGPARAFRAVDALVLVLFFLIALACWRLQNPIGPADLSGDQANIASFAAATDHPVAFARDVLLSKRSNWAWYTPLQVQLARALTWLSGDAAHGFALLIVPVVFLWLGGSYLLFRQLSGSRVLAVGLALVIGLLRAGLPTGELWDMISLEAMLPRTMFTALLPWVLLFAWELRSRPRRWFWVGLAGGALFLVHPGVAPAWAAALFVAFAASVPLREWRSGRLPVWLASLLVGLALPAAPYLLRFSTSRARSGSGGVDYATLYRIAVARFPRGYFDVPGTVLAYLRALADFRLAGGVILLILATLGAIWVYRRDPKARGALGFWGAALLGFAAVTVALPWAEQAVARWLARMPLTFNLVRGLRFWPLWAGILLSAAIRPFFARGDARREEAGPGPESVSTPSSLVRRAGPLVFCLLLGLSWWTMLWRPPGFLEMRAKGVGGASAAVTTARGLLTPRVLDASRNAEKADLDGVLTAARNGTPEGALFVGPLQLRFAALRPLAYSPKDGGVFVYSNAQAAVEWRDQADLYSKAETAPPTEQVALLRRVGAEYAVLQTVWWKSDAADTARVLYRNPGWVLVDLWPNEPRPLP
jgi:hypothetical protein